MFEEGYVMVGKLVAPSVETDAPTFEKDVAVVVAGLLAYVL
jgi:hypothetical protein